MSEIRLRAIAQIGKISRELEKALPNKGHGILTGEKTKEQHPKAAGISVPTANRYEELAAPTSNWPRGRERHGELFCHDRCGEEGPTVWWHRSSDQKTDRRRLFILILLRMSEGLGAWATLFLLGAYHGINPGMGWLFAEIVG